MPEIRRRYDKDFKDGAVLVVLETGRPAAEIAREMNINPGTLTNWVAKAREKRGDGNEGLSESEREELKRLRSENSELRMQRDVLKRSTALWVDEAMGRRP